MNHPNDNNSSENTGKWKLKQVKKSYTESLTGANEQMKHKNETQKIKKMETVYHAANTRGYANHGWLEARHSFSFASWYNPERIHFGALRVLNDDRISAGMGFGTHPHDNMEIITIPLEGGLAHKDSMGNGTTILAGDIQVMSAGTGILHSEFNAHQDKDAKILQIWVFPDRRDVTPRYDQMTLNKSEMKQRFAQILSPHQQDAGVWIHQQAWFHLGQFDPGTKTSYTWKKEDNGLYIFVIEGALTVAGQHLNQRDGLGVSGVNTLDFEFTDKSTVLLMEVPMQF